MTQLQAHSIPFAEPRAGFLGFIADQRRFEWLMIAVLAATSVLKGLHSPLPWAYTQAQLDYRFGIVRRGLVGATFGRLLGLQHFSHFRVFSFVVLGTAFALVTLLLRQSRVLAVVPDAKLPALLASSFALTFLVHLAGYLDLLLLALAAGFVLIRGRTARLLLLPVVLVVGVLVHEEFLLLFASVLLLTFVLDAVQDRGRPGIWTAVVGGLFAILLTVAVSHRTVTAAQMSELQTMASSRVDAPINPVFFAILTTPLKASVRLVLGYAIQPAIWTHLILPVVSMFAPVLGVLTYMNLSLARKLGQGRMLPICCAMAGLMPLALSVLGTDIARWFADATAASVLVLCAICARVGKHSLHVTSAVRNLIVLFIVLNLVTGEQLMGGQQINSFPYTDLIQYAIRGALGRS